MSGIDINRGTSGVYLPPAVSTDIWQATQEQSGVMSAGTQISLPGPGISVPIITGDPTANWTAETTEKPVSRGSLNYKVIQPYTLAVIEPFSNQFRRDLPSLYNALVQRLPLALAKMFDLTVFGAAAGAPGSNFDTLGSCRCGRHRRQDLSGCCRCADRDRYGHTRWRAQRLRPLPRWAGGSHGCCRRFRPAAVHAGNHRSGLGPRGPRRAGVPVACGVPRGR
jgi:hypothetical protein